MGKHRNETEKLSLLKEYLTSGEKPTPFCKKRGFSLTALKKWLADYGLTPLKPSSDEMAGKKTSQNGEEKLKLELAELRREKAELEKKLEKAELKALAYNTLIDLAESTYHVKIRKNSDAK